MHFINTRKSTTLKTSLARLGEILLFCLLTFTSYAQNDGVVINNETRLFQIETSVDTIEFIKLDTSLHFRRPVFIMLQGSLPIPLIIESGSRTIHTSFPYSTKEIRKTHHIINISMPHIPVEVEPHEIQSDGRLIRPSPRYNKRNYLDNYVRRTNEVINFLIQQTWVDSSQIDLFGHSQGCYVAIKTARANANISSIALSSFNPNGRVSGQVDRIRALEHLGQLSSNEAQKKITDFYDRWAYLVSHSEDDTAKRGDTNKATVSFSEDFTDDLLVINIPMYIMYGSRDYGALGSDFLPIQFELSGKSKYQFSVFPGLGHNYEEISEDGNSDFSKMHWQKAFDSYNEWLQRIRNQ